MGKTELKIEIDSDLLARAREAGVDPATASEVGLRVLLADEASQRPLGIVANAAIQAADPAGAEARSRRWAQENAEAIAEHNAWIEKHGVFGEDLRTW